jgi:hypothetical protein
VIAQTGSAATGAPFAGTEYIDFAAFVTLANGTTLNPGQVVHRDVTQVVNTQSGTGSTSSVSDMTVLASSANAGSIYGVYQGPAVANASGGSLVYGPFLFRRIGAGLVRVGVPTSTGTAVKVGDYLVMAQPSGAEYAVSAAATITHTVGQAIATGAVTAIGSTIVAVPGSGTTTQTVNADIRIE